MEKKEIDEFEDFDEIEKAGTLNAEVSLSNVYNVKIGGFGLEQSIKTYLCTVRVSELEEDVAFYETLTKDKSWPVSQIIQREVDRIRVSNISKDYILGKGRDVKYFPPLIIALLPKDNEGRIDLKFVFETDSSERVREIIYERSKYRSNPKMKDLFLASKNKSLVEGLYVLEISKVFDFNVVSWDRAKYYAIIIDGQHRLASLIRSRKDNVSITNYLQDVVFMDFSYLVRSQVKQLSPVEVVRRVFIDINTNAKRVSPVRQILMDDKDLASLFVQSMVDAVNTEGTEKTGDLYLKSQIVDWYGESFKHTLPHLTGILSLYQILEDYLIQTNLSSIQDLRSTSKVEAWVNRMNEYFRVDAKIQTVEKYSNLEKLSTSLLRYKANISNDKAYDDDVPDENKETQLFSYDYGVLDVAKDTFDSLFLRSLVTFFNELIPYSETLKLIENAGGFNNETVISSALISSRSKISDSRILKDSIAELRTTLESDLYEKYYHIFTVLGQKVLFYLLFQRIFTDYNSYTTEAQILGTTRSFLEEVNRMFDILTLNKVNLFDKRENVKIEYPSNNELIEFGTLATLFWEGIIYENGKIIYNTQGIKSLSSIIQHILSRIAETLDGKIKPKEFSIAFMGVRIKRILRSTFNVYDERYLKRYQMKLIKAKENFLEDYLSSAIKAYSQKKL